MSETKGEGPARISFCIECSAEVRWGETECAACRNRVAQAAMPQRGRAKRPGPAKAKDEAYAVDRTALIATVLGAAAVLMILAYVVLNKSDETAAGDPKARMEAGREEPSTGASDGSGREARRQKPSARATPVKPKSAWERTELRRRDTYAHGVPLEVDYDKFDDRTTLRAKVDVGDRIKVHWTASWRGSRPVGWPDHAWCTLTATSKTWRFLKYHRVVFLADGKRIEPKTDHDGTVGTGYVLELIQMRLSVAELAALTAAPFVEGKLGTSTFVIDKTALDALHDLLTRGVMR